jgi:hypothetical protein
MHASLISQMKTRTRAERRHTDLCMQVNLLKEALGKKGAGIRCLEAKCVCSQWVNAGQRIAASAVVRRGIGIVLACPLLEWETFEVTESCHHCSSKLSDRTK